MCDAAGIPLAVTIDGANVPDVKLLERTLEALATPRPAVEHTGEQGVCLDKGYDAKWVREHLLTEGFVPHVRSRGEEKKQLEPSPGVKARRWVVERSLGWLNRYRGILVRWCKKPENYLGCLHLACGLVSYQQAGLLG